MNNKQRLDRYKGDFESILELLDNIEIKGNDNNITTIQAICEDRIKEIENLLNNSRRDETNEKTKR